MTTGAIQAIFDIPSWTRAIEGKPICTFIGKMVVFPQFLRKFENRLDGTMAASSSNLGNSVILILIGSIIQYVKVVLC